MHMHIKLVNTFGNWQIDGQCCEWQTKIKWAKTVYHTFTLAHTCADWYTTLCGHRLSIGPALKDSTLVLEDLHHCTVHLLCRPSKSPRTSLFLQRLPRSASSSPLHCWRLSIFGCLPSAMELPTTGGYVGIVSCDILHSSQEISF